MSLYQRGDKVTIIGPSWNGSNLMLGQTFSVRGMTNDGMVAVRRKPGDTTNNHWKYPVGNVKPYHEPAKKQRRSKQKVKLKVLAMVDAILKNIDSTPDNPKLAKAQAALKRWTTKLKRATTECRKYAKQIKYYQKKEQEQP